MNGTFTDLYLYPGKLAFVNTNFSHLIEMHFDLMFEIIEDQDKTASGIRIINDGHIYEFRRSFWHRSREWESELLKQVKRKNFH